ncbi:amidohydrolase 2 [Westerdykella ornata]|uniref:6-methylsalicylate decarboxylase n=1 Tax=Westerdykella ornata TaxID=318751 RepID=A0A6A6JVU6_WESOR|nr:amidohydrolase 2 [Westerdykella ornata]KAF2279938.1 amidohydrolase 2 [Westerdykella ornata]
MASSSSTSLLPPRIDVHSHFIPQFYDEALRSTGHQKPDGMPGIPSWSIEEHLQMMAANNVTKSILSISSPGTWLSSQYAYSIGLTASLNRHAAHLKETYPDKFGYWASLPLPNIESSIREIRQCQDSADGFCLLTNYHGLYLGHPRFDRVFRELDDLRATVFIHPTTPCTVQGVPPTPATPLAQHHPSPKFEFLFDTARAVIDLFSSGTVQRYPHITYILPHAGGCLPPTWTRMVQWGHVVPGEPRIDPQWARERLDEQFYFDLAGWVFDGPEGGSGQLKALVHGYGISHERLLYGSDYPFTRPPSVRAFAERMQNGLECLFTESERKAIYEKNAERLLGKKRTQLRNC